MTALLAPPPTNPTTLPRPACVCAWCGGWRDDARTWHPGPAEPRGERPVTHGICPACETAWVAEAFGRG